MPKYFSSKAEMLYAEAKASFMLIESICAQNIHQGIIPDKLCKIYQNAQARCSRRFYSWQKGK